MDTKKLLNWVVLVLLIVGGLNWGIAGLLNISVVHVIFGEILARLIYILVGAAAVYKIYELVQEYKAPKKPEPKPKKEEKKEDTPK